MQQTPLPTVHDPMQELVDIYDFWHTPWWQTKAFYTTMIIAAILLTSLLVWIMVRFISSRKRITAWDHALHELNLLRQMPVINEQDMAKHYFVLRTVLKQYIDARYGVYFADKTDEELLEALPHVLDRPAMVYDIKELLRQSEQAVFAAAAPSPSMLNAGIATAVSVIKQTIPQKK